MKPEKQHAPARRATDAFIGLGFCGVAGFMWIVVVRVSITDPGVALLYALFAGLVTAAGVGIVRLVTLHRLAVRRVRLRSGQNKHFR
jgi:hypothetical protein